MSSPDVAATLSLALEIARDGGEEHRVGALFTLGNAIGWSLKDCKTITITARSTWIVRREIEHSRILFAGS